MLLLLGFFSTGEQHTKLIKSVILPDVGISVLRADGPIFLFAWFYPLFFLFIYLDLSFFFSEYIVFIGPVKCWTKRVCTHFVNSTWLLLWECLYTQVACCVRGIIYKLLLCCGYRVGVPLRGNINAQIKSDTCMMSASRYVCWWPTFPNRSLVWFCPDFFPYSVGSCILF